MTTTSRHTSASQREQKRALCLARGLYDPVGQSDGLKSWRETRPGQSERSAGQAEMEQVVQGLVFFLTCHLPPVPMGTCGPLRPHHCRLGEWGLETFPKHPAS